MRHFQASFNALKSTNLTWRARVPNGALLTFVAYPSQDRDKLDEASPIEVTLVPGDDSANEGDASHETADVTPQRSLR